MSVERAFETDSILLRDRTGVVAFDVDPLTTGFNAPIGSLGMRTTGQHYRKVGALDTDWAEVDGARELQFSNRAGASENIAIIYNVSIYQLPFFNRSNIAENIAII